MGVSVRTSRNTRVSVPFVIAVPWAVCVLAGWTLYGLVHGTFVAVGWAVRTVQARRAASR